MLLPVLLLIDQVAAEGSTFSSSGKPTTAGSVYDVLLVADSQAYMLDGSGSTKFYDLLSSLTKDALSKSLPAPSTVNYHISSRAWRRISECWTSGCAASSARQSCCYRGYRGNRACGNSGGETVSCTAATDAVQAFCRSSKPVVVVTLCCVNDLKTYTWRQKLPVQSQFEELFRAVKTSCGRTTPILAVDPMPLIPDTHRPHSAYVQYGSIWSEADRDPPPGRSAVMSSMIQRAADAVNEQMGQDSGRGVGAGGGGGGVEHLETTQLVDQSECLDGGHYRGAKTARMMAQAIADKVAPMLCVQALRGTIGEQRAHIYCRGRISSSHNTTCINKPRRRSGTHTSGKGAGVAAGNSSSVSVDGQGGEGERAIGLDELADLPGGTGAAGGLDAESGASSSSSSSSSSSWVSADEPNSACNGSASSSDTPAGRARSNATCAARESPMLATIIA